MKEKYLPIGTVCTIANGMKKYMIVGYYSVEYQNSIKKYDYVAYPYPEGFLDKNHSISFNHSDITSIDFIGYESELYKNFNNILLGQNVYIDKQVNKEEEKTSNSNYVFDENGVVVLDNLEKVNNPFMHDYSNNIYNSNLEKPQVGNYVFDENGMVVSDNNVQNAGSKTENNQATSGYKFDENGVVISDNAEQNAGSKTENNQATSGYKFDENGVVVSDNAEQSAGSKTENSQATSGYKFDENGVVVAE